MQGFTHLAIGFTAGSIISNSLNIDPLISEAVCCLGSIIVDIDAPSSMINRILFRGHAKTRNFLKFTIGCMLIFINYFKLPIFHQYHWLLTYIGIIILLSIASMKVSYKFSLFGGVQKLECHRTLFHDPCIGTFLFCIIPFFFFKLGSFTLFVPFLIGVLLHYFADSFTAYGLPFYLTKKRIRMPIHYKSNNIIFEYIISGAIIFIMFSFQYDVHNILSSLIHNNFRFKSW